jgi:hypothetical protein
MMNMESVLADLVQKVDNRFFGKYRGFVVDNQDPEKLGRLKLKVPSVLGDEVVTGWALPCLPFGGAADQGCLFIPDADAGVWVEFEEGDLEFPIWVGTFWSKPDGESELPHPDVPASGEEGGDIQDPPTCKIIKTKAGHTIQFEDKEGSEFVIIKDGAHGHWIALTKSGILMKDAKENSIEMTDSAFTIISKVAFTIDASGQALEIKASTIDFTKA